MQAADDYLSSAAEYAMSTRHDVGDDYLKTDDSLLMTAAWPRDCSNSSRCRITWLSIEVPQTLWWNCKRDGNCEWTQAN